jgi:tetratricopeptide (TPR) repeat protein
MFGLSNKERAVEVAQEGKRLEDAGEFAGAVEAYSAALELCSELGAVYPRRAFAYYALGQYERAVADAESYASGVPGNPKARSLVAFVKGCCQLKKGFVNAALQEMNEALRACPEEALYYSVRGSILGKLQRPAEMRADQQRAIDLRPDQPMPMVELARTMCTSPRADERDGQKAVGYAKKACERTMWKEWRFIGVLAAAHAECGNFDEAVAFAEMARKVAPDEEKGELAARVDQYRRKEPLRDAEVAMTVPIEF